MISAGFRPGLLTAEEVIITKRRRETVARLLLPAAPKKNRPQKPDLAARLKKVFGRKIISSQAMKELWGDDRGDY